MAEENAKPWVKEFSKCPGCGSTERYFEGILNELKKRGLLEAKIRCFDFQKQQGLGLPPQKIAILPFGSEIPVFNRIYDTCCNCGMDYSVYLERGSAKKSIEVASAPPSRQESRHPDRYGLAAN